MLHRVLDAFGIEKDCKIEGHGNGLINHTYRISCENQEYILQRLNDAVFIQPVQVAENIDQVSEFIERQFPSVIFPKPLKTKDGTSLLFIPQEGYFRIFPFIRNSVTLDVVNTPAQAYEAAKQFGAFTSMLSNFPIGLLHETLPAFHNLSLRYQAFADAVIHGNPERKIKSETLISYLESQHHLVKRYEEIINNIDFKLRVTHHDTKISNVLFDHKGRGLCVIDLDTIMPGYFISDVGDMFRTYVSPVSEEEKDFSKIEIRLPVIDAIIDGYLLEMKDELTPAEKDSFIFAGEFMMYMQALRFLTDYLNNDVYYGRRYEVHNFIRAGNQSTLLMRFQEKSDYINNKMAAFVAG